MKFKVDENLPIEVAELLQKADHNATTVHEESLSGEIDSRLAVVCQSEQRTLITFDADFADIRAYPPSEHNGIIVLRLKQQDIGSVLKVVARVIKALSTEELARHLWVVDENRIRVRG